MPGRHSKLSPSGSNRWFKCTASVKLIESLDVVETENAAAIEGTLAHETFYVATGKANPFAVKYGTPEEELHLPTAIEYVVRLQELYPDAPLYREVRVQPARYVGTRHAAGTADIILPVDNGPLYVIDLKFGRGVVEVLDNTQLLLYGLGALAKFRDYQFTEIVLVILQPRAYHEDGPIREWRLKIREIRRWARKLRAAAREALSDEGVFNPDPEAQCKYCPAAGVCRAYAEYELQQATKVFGPITEEPLDLHDPRVLSPKELSHLLDHIPGILKWAEKVKHVALTHVEKGGRLPYWTIESNMGHRQWAVDENELLERFDEEVLYDKKLRTPTQVEKDIPGKLDSDLVTRKYLGQKLVKTDDSSETPVFGVINNGESEV